MALTLAREAPTLAPRRTLAAGPRFALAMASLGAVLGASAGLAVLALQSEPAATPTCAGVQYVAAGPCWVGSIEGEPRP